MTIFGNISRAINIATGGAKGQTLCARIAASRPDCWFCRFMERYEKNHCLVELARWDRRGMNCALRLRWG